jgi:hypothetical protein
VDPKFGLTGEDFPLRTQHFGNNYRPPLIAKTWLKLFWAALDDFMLKVLIFASIFSIVFDMILASPENRSHGKYLTKLISPLKDDNVFPLCVRERALLFFE